MAPVRLVAGAILALSGAASWLLPDPWTPPPQTCNADFTEGFACAPDPGGASSASYAPPPPSGSGASTCDANLGGCLASPAPASSTLSATSNSSTASSAATPPTEGPGRPRARTGAPPIYPPPFRPWERFRGFGGSGNEPDSWPYRGWRLVLRSPWSRCGPFCWRIGAAVQAAGYHGQQHHTARNIRDIRDLDRPPSPSRESGLVRRPLPWGVDTLGYAHDGGRSGSAARLVRARVAEALDLATCRRRCVDEVSTIVNLMTSTSVMRVLTPGFVTGRSKVGRIVRATSARTRRC